MLSRSVRSGTIWGLVSISLAGCCHRNVCPKTMYPSNRLSVALSIKKSATKTPNRASRAILITLGDAPPWLVSRYSVALTYPEESGNWVSESNVFPASGGVIQGTLPSVGGTFPDHINLEVTIDFMADSGLQGVTTKYSVKVDDVGAVQLVEPVKTFQSSLLLIRVPKCLSSKDFLALTWAAYAGTAELKANKAVIREECYGVIRAPIAYLPGAQPADAFHIEIKGVYRNKSFTTYRVALPVDQPAIVLTFVRDPKTGTYGLRAEQ